MAMLFEALREYQFFINLVVIFVLWRWLWRMRSNNPGFYRRGSLAKVETFSFEIGDLGEVHGQHSRPPPAPSRPLGLGCRSLR